MSAPAPAHVLDGRAALVTGAAAGIGRAIALAFLGAGAKVVFVDTDLEALTRLQKEAPGDALFLEADVTAPDAPSRCLEGAEAAFGPVTILVNNAGVAGPTLPVDQIGEADWERTLAVNLTAPFRWAAEFVRRLPPAEPGRERGCVVNLASVSGKRPLVNRAPYCASKMGVIGLTRCLAAELGPKGVRVNALCPGAVEGERIVAVLQGRAAAHGRSYEEEMAATVADTPLGRLVRPEDVADAAVFLASDAARFVTGEDMNVTGGRVMY